MKKLLILIFMAALLTGCATRGRLSVVDIDLRDASQIEADKSEASVVYQDVSTNATAKSFDFSIISTLLSVVKGRIRVLSVEWKQ